MNDDAKVSALFKRNRGRRGYTVGEFVADMRREGIRADGEMSPEFQALLEEAREKGGGIDRVVMSFDFEQPILVSVWERDEVDTPMGRMARFSAAGLGRTVLVWKLDGKPLCVDVYAVQVSALEQLEGRTPDWEFEYDRPMPDEERLHFVAHDFMVRDPAAFGSVVV